MSTGHLSANPLPRLQRSSASQQPSVACPIQSLRLLYPVTSSISPPCLPWKPPTLNIPDACPRSSQTAFSLSSSSSSSSYAPLCSRNHQSLRRLKTEIWESSPLLLQIQTVVKYCHLPFINVSQTCPFLSTHCRHNGLF